MNSTALTLLSLSISGSVLAIVLFALKPLIKHKVSKAFSYYIWIIVLLRLTLPVAAPVNAMDALFNSPAVTAPQTIEAPNEGAAVPGDTVGNDMQHIAPEANTPHDDTVTAPQSAMPARTFDLWAFVKANILWIWAAGAFISIAWFVRAYLRFYRLIKRNNTSPLREDEAIFRSLCKNRNITLACNSYVKTPMLIGIFHPVIVVPQIAYARNGMGQTLTNILCHELTHYKRKDLAYKWLVVFVSSLHWFNPLMILVRREIARACELSCDEAVIWDMTDNDKQIYGDTLLALSTNRRLPTGILATTLCERKSELKERLISIMKYKKKTAGIAVLSIILALALTGCGVMPGTATDKNDEVKSIDKASGYSTVAPAQPKPSERLSPTTEPEPSETAWPQSEHTSPQPESSMAPKTEKTISLGNDLGTAELAIGDSVQNTLEHYASLSEYRPAQEDIDRLAKFGDNTSADGIDGFYGGPAPNGDLNGEVSLGFYNDQLNYIQIGTTLLKDTPITKFVLLESIINTTTFEEACVILGDPVNSSETSVVYNEYRFNVTLNGIDCRIIMDYDKENRTLLQLCVSADV